LDTLKIDFNPQNRKYRTTINNIEEKWNKVGVLDLITGPWKNLYNVDFSICKEQID
jgi:hypothetical protein